MQTRRRSTSVEIEPLESRRLLAAVQLLLPDTTGVATPNKGVDNVLISPNGRYLAFQTKSNNVLGGITDSDATKADLYLQDRLTGTLRLVSFAAGTPNTTATGTITVLEFSPDSRFILIYGQSTNLTGATETGTYLYDIFTNTNVRVSSNAASTSQDGFVTTAGQTTGLAYEAGNAFLYQIATGVSSVLSRRPDGTFNPSATGGSQIHTSPDGRYVAFESYSNDIASDSTEPSGNNDLDLFIRDLSTNTTTRVTKRVGGDFGTGDAGIPTGIGFSPSGRYFAYRIDASFTNLVGGVPDTNQADDLIVYDTVTKTNHYVTQRAVDSTNPNDPGPAASKRVGPPLVDDTLVAQWAGGDRLIVETTATELVLGVTDTNNGLDLFVYDAGAQTTTLVTRSANGPSTGTADSFISAVTPLGDTIAFRSSATDLLPGLVGGNDLYTYNLDTGEKKPVTITTSGTLGGGTFDTSAITPDGKWVAFVSPGISLVTGVTDNNSGPDLFLRNMETGTTQIISVSPASAALRFTLSSNSVTSFLFSQDNSMLIFRDSAAPYSNAFTDANSAFDAFAVELSKPPPTAELTAVSNVTQAVNSVNFDVVYRADTTNGPATIDLQTLNLQNTQDIAVGNGKGFVGNATLTSVSGSGSEVTAHYTIAGPGGNFDSSDDGTYEISVNPSQVGDDQGRFVAAGAVGIFTVNIPSPPPPPAASVTSAKNVTKSGGKTYTFKVTYTDSVGINTATIGGGDIQVTGPKHFKQNVTLVSKTPTSGNAKSITVTYKITAPGGTFEKGDNGTYSLKLLANQVKNTAGTAVAAATLGTIQVNTPSRTSRVFNISKRIVD